MFNGYGGMGMNPAMGGYAAYGAGMGGYGGGGGGYGGGRTGGRGYGGRGGGDYSSNEAGYGQGGGRGGGRGGSRPEHEFVEGKLFLGGLDTNTTKQALVDYCQQWGELSDHVLMEGRGFGFVTFSDPAGAQTFLEHRDHMIDGKRVEAKAAVPRSAGSGNTLTKKMFVGGTGEVKDEDFKNYFEQFGEIEDCVVLRKPDGGSRGFGFVTYKDEISVEKCLVMQHQLNGRTVELKRAIKKEEMGPGSYQSGGYGQETSGYTGGGYGGGTGGSGGPMRTGKQPDWLCPSGDCRNRNFGWRDNCNRCQVAKPSNPELAPGRGANSSGTSSYGSGRQNGGYGDSSSGVGMNAGYASMGMPGMGAYGMGAYGMGGMAGMGMSSMGMAGYGGGANAYGNMGGGYGRAAGGGRGAGSGQGRYRPY